MFANHPELLAATFNRGNQARCDSSGTGRIGRRVRQHLIQKPEHVTESLLRRIAHKHASLGIRPDQYPVVYDHLF